MILKGDTASAHARIKAPDTRSPNRETLAVLAEWTASHIKMEISSARLLPSSVWRIKVEQCWKRWAGAKGQPWVR